MKKGRPEEDGRPTSIKQNTEAQKRNTKTKRGKEESSLICRILLRTKRLFTKRTKIPIIQIPPIRKKDGSWARDNIQKRLRFFLTT